MTLAALLNLPVTIISRSRSADSDEFGNEQPGETLVQTVGELQQQHRAEPDAAGELSDSTWLLILPAGETIKTGDGVIAGGQVYELIGDPWHARNPRTQEPSHIECTLRRTAADEDGS